MANKHGPFCQSLEKCKLNRRYLDTPFRMVKKKLTIPSADGDMEPLDLSHAHVVSHNQLLAFTQMKQKLMFT